MPKTQYGIRVTPNARKQYGFKASAAPLLSNQKRYVVQVENKIVQQTSYPVTLPSTSRRKARMITPDLVRRKTREVLVDLLQAEKGTVTPHVLNTTIVQAENALIAAARVDVIARDLEVVERKNAQEAAIVLQEKANKQLEHEASCVDALSASLIERIFETNASISEKIDRQTDVAACLSESDQLERHNETDSWLNEGIQTNAVNTTVSAVLSFADQWTRNNIKEIHQVDVHPMDRVNQPLDGSIIRSDMALRASSILNGHLFLGEVALVKHKEFLAELKLMDGVLGAGKPVLEMRISSAKRNEKTVQASFVEPTKAEDANRIESGTLLPIYPSTRTIKELEGVEKETIHTKRPEKIMNTQLYVSDHAERTYNTELALLLQQSKTTRRTKVINTQIKQNDVTKRLNMTDIAIIKSTHAVERVNNTDVAMSCFTEPVERASRPDAALLTESISSDRNDEGIETLIRSGEQLERVTQTDSQMSDHDATQRIAIEETQLIESVPVDRVTINYAEMVEFSHAMKTMKSGVLVEAETVNRIAVEETILFEQEKVELYVKKKKKIWLIPARGNHWNSWSGWKKTR